MQLSPLRSKEARLGDRDAVAPADPEIGPGARISSSVPVALGPGDPGACSRQKAACRPVLPRSPLHAIGLAVLIWLLNPGQQAVTAGNVAAQKEVPTLCGLQQATSTLRVVAGSFVLADRQQNRSIHSSDGRLFGFPDEMAWDDDNGETAPPIAWLQERNFSSIAPAVGSTPTWIEPPASPLLMPARLRC
ncbi:hypothetical protein [Singulisphaera acidiphila]|uniref:hypothetical protein n=1 Tax=Singulisphaera acidiphila TaxID=466153 RepID=UPI00036F44CA|nr:hypothetical protein [Singulisphaera acidiphila]